MAEPKLAGHILDQDDTELEVWLDEDEAKVLLIASGMLHCCFAFGNPEPNDPLQMVAQRIAGGEAKRMYVFVDTNDGSVYEDTERFKTLRRWPGDGKVH